jgi:hypothetical protein
MATTRLSSKTLRARTNARRGASSRTATGKAGAAETETYAT